MTNDDTTPPPAPPTIETKEPTLSEMVHKHEALLSELPYPVVNLLAMPRGNEGVAQLSRKNPMVRMYDALFVNIDPPNIPDTMSSELAVTLAVLLFRGGWIPSFGRHPNASSNLPTHLTIMFAHMTTYGWDTLQDVALRKPDYLPESVVDYITKMPLSREVFWDIHDTPIHHLAVITTLVAAPEIKEGHLLMMEYYPWLEEVGVVGTWEAPGKHFRVKPYLCAEYWRRVIEEEHPTQLSEIYRSDLGVGVVVSGHHALYAFYCDPYGLENIGSGLYPVPEVVQMYHFELSRTSLRAGQLEPSLRQEVEALTLSRYYSQEVDVNPALLAGFETYREKYLSSKGYRRALGRIYFKI